MKTNTVNLGKIIIIMQNVVMARLMAINIIVLAQFVVWQN